jgi:biotin carboxyl carrier protein
MINQTLRYRVKISGRTFEVEIQDLNTVPVVAIVDGESVEVWPQGSTNTQGVPKTAAWVPKSEPAEMPASLGSLLDSGNEKKAVDAVKAPIPGVIASISVQPGDEVQTGQELCVLEAMKMKNSIRSPRPGRISGVKVTPGQAVNHHDLLFEFAQPGA